MSFTKQKQRITFIAVDEFFYASSFDCRSQTNLLAIKTKLGNVGVEAYLTWTP